MSIAAGRPAFVTLRLTSPRQEHPSVEWLQRLVNDRSPKYVRPPLPVDGIFGAWTAHEAEELLYRLGAPNPEPALSVGDLQVLWRWSNDAPLPSDWQVRRLARMATGFRRGWGITARSWMGLHPGQFPPPKGAAYDPADALEVMRGWADADWQEEPAGSNVVPPMQALARELGVRGQFVAMGYFWCQFAAYLAGLEAGGATARAGLVDGSFWPLYTPATLAMGQRREWGHALIPVHLVKAGDMAMFHFDSAEIVQHVGRVEEPPGQLVATIDGNTSSSSQDNGGAVMHRERSASTVVGYVRDS